MSPVRIEGEPQPVRLTIQEHYGRYTVTYVADGREVTQHGSSLDSVLGKAAPGAPDNYVLHASSVLRGILGAST